MKRRNFLKKCGGPIVAGFSVFTVNREIADIRKMNVVVPIDTRGQTLTEFLENEFLDRILFIDRNRNPVYFALSKVEMDS